MNNLMINLQLKTLTSTLNAQIFQKDKFKAVL